MALQINLKNKDDADTIHAVIRMDGKTYAALRLYMKPLDRGDHAIHFSYGVSIVWRGRGWYRMECSGPARALDKLTFAIKVVKRFLADAERKTDEEIKRLRPIMMNPGLVLASFSNMHSEADWGFIGKPSPQVKVPPTQNKLNALVAKFQRSQKA